MYPHSTIKYRPDIDGLRAIAVLLVICFHAFPHLATGGFVGVDIFFVISGFLISGILIQGLEEGTFSFTNFYLKRIRRIFPALIIVLLACLIFGWFALYPSEYKQLGSHICAGAGFISNFLLWHNTGYFDSAAATKPLLHLWSLGVEEQFYIIWPLLLWISWKKKLNLITVVIFIALTSFVFNLQEIDTDKVGAFFSPQTRFWELLLGGILAFLIFYKKDKLDKIIIRLEAWLITIIYSNHREYNGYELRNMLSFLGLLMIVYSATVFTKTLSFPGAWALIPTVGALLIIMSGPDAWVNRRILSKKIMVGVGLISYPLYLWHWPLLSFVQIMEEDNPSRSVRITIVVLSFILAWLTYRLIEKPLRSAQFRKMDSYILMGCMFIIGCLGLSVWYFNGFDYRYAKGINSAIALATSLASRKKIL